MTLASSSRCISDFIPCTFSSDIFLCFCFFWFHFRVYVEVVLVIVLLTPLRSEVDQAKTSLCFLRKLTSSYSSSIVKYDPMITSLPSIPVSRKTRLVSCVCKVPYSFLVSRSGKFFLRLVPLVSSSSCFVSDCKMFTFFFLLE